MKKVFFDCETAFSLYVKGEPHTLQNNSKHEIITEYFLDGTLAAKSVRAKNGAFGAWIDKKVITDPNLLFVRITPRKTHYKIAGIGGVK